MANEVSDVRALLERQARGDDKAVLRGCMRRVSASGGWPKRNIRSRVISPVAVEWHAGRHLRGVARRSPSDPRELLIDLDYTRSQAAAVAQAAASEGKHTLRLAALKEYRECTQAICKLVDARATDAG